MQTVIIADKKQDTLAKRIVDQLNIPLLEPETAYFADSEMRVTFDDPLSLLPGSHAIIVHSTSYPVHDNLMWILLVCHALRLKKVQKITAVIPYFGYSRQDKTDEGGPGAVQLIAQLLETAGIQQLITVVLHEPNVISLFSIDVYNISLESFIINFITKHFDTQKLTLVAPDKGAAEYTEALADKIHAQSAFFKKERYAIDKTRIIASKGTCTIGDALIVDDIIDTGGTIINVADALNEESSCTQYVFAVHPVLSLNASERLQESPFKTVWVTNTIQLPHEKEFQKLKIVDVSAEISKVLQEII